MLDGFCKSIRYVLGTVSSWLTRRGISSVTGFSGTALSCTASAHHYLAAGTLVGVSPGWRKGSSLCGESHDA
jgi:hypothetical protein